MKKSYEKLKQSFNPQVPSAEVLAGMIEEGHRWCKGIEGRKERGGRYSKEEVEEAGRRKVALDRIKEANAEAGSHVIGELRRLGWRLGDLEFRMRGRDEGEEKRKRKAIKEREEKAERNFHEEQLRRKRRGERVQTLAEVEKVEKVREMPALIKIKGLNIRENQKWKSSFN